MSRIISRIADFFRETDKLLLSVCIIASLFGCCAVYSSTRYLDTLRPFTVQLFCLLMGIVAAIIISAFDFETFLNRWYLAAAVGLIPVILTFFIGFAPDGTDDKAWLDLGLQHSNPLSF